MGAKNKQGEVLRRAGSSVLYLRIPPQVCVAPSATIRANCPFYLEEEKRNTTYHKDAHDQVDDREDETAVNITSTSDIVGHDGMLAFDEKQRRETTRKQGIGFDSMARLYFRNWFLQNPQFCLLPPACSG